MFMPECEDSPGAFFQIAGADVPVGAVLRRADAEGVRAVVHQTREAQAIEAL